MRTKTTRQFVLAVCIGAFAATGVFGGATWPYLLKGGVALAQANSVHALPSARTEFMLDFRRGGVLGNSSIDGAEVDGSNSYAAMFNTMLSQWRGVAVVAETVKSYRRRCPNSAATDMEIVETLAQSKIELRRNSRVISLTVQSTNGLFAVALADAYAEAIERFTDEENTRRCDKAAARIHAQVEKSRSEKDQLAADLQEFRATHSVEALRSQSDAVKASIASTTRDILELEAKIKELDEWVRFLTAVQKNPRRFETLVASVSRSKEIFESLVANDPRAQEIADEYAAFRKRSAEYDAMTVNYTDAHPEVVAKVAEREAAKKSFLDAVSCAHEAGTSMLAAAKVQLTAHKASLEQSQAELASLCQQINIAEGGLSVLESEYGIAVTIFQQLLLDEQKVRMEAEADSVSIRIISSAVLLR